MSDVHEADMSQTEASILTCHVMYPYQFPRSAFFDAALHTSTSKPYSEMIWTLGMIGSAAFYGGGAVQSATGRLCRPLQSVTCDIRSVTCDIVR